MTTYLSRLLDSKGFKRIDDIKPEGLCPFLNYNIAPYIFTLANGGWFSWIKRTKNPTDRKPARIKNPALTKTNRLFTNEVLVRCPNPDVTVIAGIGPWEDNTVVIRILHRDGDCPCHHEPGQQIFPGKKAGDHALQYSSLFPEILTAALTDLSFTKVLSLYDEGRAGSIHSKTIIQPCRYHRRPTRYDYLHLLPDNCCPHVFQQIYPPVLAVMYGAEINVARTIQHPGEKDTLRIKIEKAPIARPRLIRIFKDSLDAVFSRLFHPLDRLDYTLAMNVLAAETGAACSMNAGQHYAVNLKSPDYLCPAGFHAVYPYLLLAAAGKKMDWGHTSKTSPVPCPDCAGVIYGI